MGLCSEGLRIGTNLKVLHTLWESLSGEHGVCIWGVLMGESVNNGASVIKGWLMGVSILDVLLGISISG